jgi:hypothetical protein
MAWKILATWRMVFNEKSRGWGNKGVKGSKFSFLLAPERAALLQQVISIQPTPANGQTPALLSHL